MNKYWQVKAKLKTENDQGKVQVINEIYLVNAVSATDAESKVVESKKDQNEQMEFLVVECKQTKILEVIE